MNLSRRARRASLWTLVEIIGAQGLGTLFMLVLARVLAPADYGIYATISITMSFALRIAVFGFSASLIRADQLTQRLFSTAFWLAIPLSVSVALGLILASGSLADVVDQPAMATLLPIVAATLPFSVAADLMASIPRRELDMRPLAQRTIAASFVGGLVAIGLALSGWGSAALVAQYFTAAMLTFIFTLRLVGLPLLGLTFDRGLARQMLGFGAPITATDLLTQYNNDAPRIFVGVVLGTEALGIFSMGMRLANLVASVLGALISRSTLPVLSEVRRRPGAFRPAYLRVSRVSLAIIAPAFLSVALLSEPLIKLLMGSQWLDAAPVTTLLCLAGVLQVANYVNGAALISLGRPDLRLWVALARSVVGTILLLVLTPLGLAAAAAAPLIRGVLVEPLQFAMTFRVTGTRVAEYLRAVSRVALAAIVATAIGFAAKESMSDAPSLALIIAVSSIFLSTYVGSLLLCDASIRDELKQLKPGVWRSTT